jgi:hypothetical protein
MRQVYLAAAFLLTGCCNVMGPFEHRQPQRVDDPCLPIPEQQSRGRDRFALPDEPNSRGSELAPRTGIESPGQQTSPGFPGR